MTTARKRHNWPAGTRNPKDGSLTTVCKNCGLVEVLYQEDRYRAEFFDGEGALLEFTKRPECPKEPTW